MSSHTPITILAPARDLVVGKAAIDAGADAVYIGAPMFGARQAACNSLEDIHELVDYAHKFDAKVLVTLNTLLNHQERIQASNLAHDLYRIGVDALIIQDLRLLKYKLPPIRLHASTQCDNRTLEHVFKLQQLGFQRVVLARELSLQEISYINQNLQEFPTRIELEAFVHGALCVSYSGQCYLSQALMNRSANRGACAQLCRQRYDLLDTKFNEVYDNHGKTIHQRYLLSLQDMDRSQDLLQMLQAGVTTFKIEGRLKDKDYVTNIVAYYRQILDKIFLTNPQYVSASKYSIYEYNFTPNPTKTFHRGSTDYFLHARTTRMANWQTPKSTGELIGKVVGLRHDALRLQLIPGIKISNGDGLCYNDQGFAVNSINGDWIIPNKIPNIRIGTYLYRNADVTFLKSLQATRKIPLDIIFEATSLGYRLTIGEISKEFNYTHQAANNRVGALHKIRHQLSKLGDTHFIAAKITIYAHNDLCVTDFPYFISTSILNEWRRTMIDAICMCTSSRVTSEIETLKPKDNIRVDKVIEVSNRSKDEISTDMALMTCKYCILHELGHCRKVNPMQNEPRYLRMQNGTVLTLHFDCNRCEMHITHASITK